MVSNRALILKKLFFIITILSFVSFVSPGRRCDQLDTAELILL